MKLSEIKKHSRHKKHIQKLSVIRLGIKGAAKLDDIVKIAIEISSNYGVDVTFVFNRINMTVTKDSTEKQVLKKYDEKLKSEHP